MALVEVSTASREVLRSELSEYLVEFARMEGVPVQRAADGSPAYEWFDACWVEDDRMPFFIEDAGEIVGFCLIRAIHGGWTIAEFGIRPERRREGVGRRSVELLAKQARGAGADHLRADVKSWNERAVCFWTACGFEEVGAAGGILSTRLTLDPSE
jgi:ribosomal protein S18 acetylase RimI-like enzyme